MDNVSKLQVQDRLADSYFFDDIRINHGVAIDDVTLAITDWLESEYNVPVDQSEALYGADERISEAIFDKWYDLHVRRGTWFEYKGYYYDAVEVEMSLDSLREDLECAYDLVAEENCKGLVD